MGKRKSYLDELSAADWFCVLICGASSSIIGLDYIVRDMVEADAYASLSSTYIGALFWEGFMLVGVVMSLFSLYKLYKMSKKKPVAEAWHGDFPYFGKVLNRNKVREIIERLTFSEYRTRDDEVLRNVLISEDGKWLQILGKYLPADLLCGYDSRKNVLITITGTAIRLPMSARSSEVCDEIERFFMDRGIWHKKMPRDAKAIYKSVCKSWKGKIDKENFGKIRYQWEKAVANSEVVRERESGATVAAYQGISGAALHGMSVAALHGEDDIFERVLSDRDLERIASDVVCREDNIERYLDFDAYSNEFSVCNGVELIKQVACVEDGEGLEFLFRCLGDVDEAYFTYAVEFLLQYPTEMVTEKIEENVRAAFERGDVVNLAGLMYLAKEMDYNIGYIEELKKARVKEMVAEYQAEAVAKALAEAAAGKIREFDFDEVAAFGSEEVQEFDGGVAYKKKA